MKENKLYTDIFIRKFFPVSSTRIAFSDRFLVELQNKCAVKDSCFDKVEISNNMRATFFL